MKARKVAILLEVLTAIPVKELRDKGSLTLICGDDSREIEIVQVNVNPIFKLAVNDIHTNKRKIY